MMMMTTWLLMWTGLNVHKLRARNTLSGNCVQNYNHTTMCTYTT